MKNLVDLRADFDAELTDDLLQMVRDQDKNRWLNDAQAHVIYFNPTSAVLTWSIGAFLVTLPADFVSFDSFHPTAVGDPAIPSYRLWHNKIRFTEKATVAGSATLFYGASLPAITGTVASVIPAVLDQALVSWALSRFYRQLAGSRTDFRRYSTLAQGNAADVPQLLSAADRHQSDFAGSVNAWQMPEAVTFFGD